MQTLPKIGDKASVAGISFPLNIIDVDPNTRFAALAGEHPETGAQVKLTQVCFDELQPSPYSLVAGDVVRLKSGGPAMTIYCVHGNEADMIYWNEHTHDFLTWEDVDLVTLVKSEDPA